MGAVPVTRFLFDALILFAELLSWAIIVRVIISWVRLGADNPVVKFLHFVTEPILSPIRTLINKSPLGRSDMPIDFSPIIAMLLIRLVVIPLLAGAAVTLAVT